MDLSERSIAAEERSASNPAINNECPTRTRQYPIPDARPGVPGVKVLVKGPDGQSSPCSYNISPGDGCFSKAFAAAVILSNPKQLNTVLLTSLSVLRAADIAETLRLLSQRDVKGSKLGLEVHAGELQLHELQGCHGLVLDQASVQAHVRQCCEAHVLMQSLSMQMLAAGIMQLGWSVIAPSQQVQPGAAHASGLSESEQRDSDRLTGGNSPGKKWPEIRREAALAQLCQI